MSVRIPGKANAAAQHFQTAAVILGYDLGLFKTLSNAQSPSSVDDLALASGAEPALLGEQPSGKMTHLGLPLSLDPLGRILRYLASVGIVDETSRHHFAANHATKTLAEDVSEAGLKH